MLPNRRFSIGTLLIMLVFFLTWIALATSATVAFREGKSFGGDPSLSAGLAAWQEGSPAG